MAIPSDERGTATLGTSAFGAGRRQRDARRPRPRRSGVRAGAGNPSGGRPRGRPIADGVHPPRSHVASVARPDGSRHELGRAWARRRRARRASHGIDEATMRTRPDHSGAHAAQAQVRRPPAARRSPADLVPRHRHAHLGSLGPRRRRPEGPRRALRIGRSSRTAPSTAMGGTQSPPPTRQRGTATRRGPCDIQKGRGAGRARPGGDGQGAPRQRESRGLPPRRSVAGGGSCRLARSKGSS